MSSRIIIAVWGVWLACAGTAFAADMPPLASAVSKGDLATVTALLQQGADPDTLWNGYTVLTWASGGGRFAIVKALVERHATIDPSVSNGWTPLRAAASNSQPDIAAYLIAHGAKVNVQSDGGWTPLDDAEAMHDAKTAKLLREHGGVSGLPPLLRTVNRGEPANLRKLLASGADPNSHDTRGATAISIAANVGSLASVQALVEHHADVNLADVSGWTPLMEAAMNGHKDIAAFLVAHGADLNAANADSQTALDIALNGKHADVAQLLRSAGAKQAAEIIDASCADFRHWADMGATSGYGSLAAGPAEPGSVAETLGLRPANVSIGGSGCNVSDDGQTLLCYWDKNNHNYTGMADYQALADLGKTCSGDSKVVSDGGKTSIWYNRVAGKTLLITFDGSDTNMTVTFGAAEPL